MCADDLTTPPLLRIAEIASTNDELARLAARGAADGTALYAERQTQGRGRRGRAWVSLPGRHIALSVLHRSSIPIARLTGITLDIGTAVARVLTRFGAEVALDWPNDILVRDKKVGGILCELIDGPCVIVGLGLNVDAVTLPPELPDATTLAAEGVSVTSDADFEALLGELVTAIRAACRDYDARGAPDVVAWRERARGIGERVEQVPEGRHGLVVGVAPDGALLVHWDGAAVPEPFIGGELRPSAGARP